MTASAFVALHLGSPGQLLPPCRGGYIQIMNKSNALKGVLLDIDGTLVLSNDAHAHAWVEAFQQHGIVVRFEDVRPLIGMGGDKTIPALAPTLDISTGQGKEINGSRKQIFLSKYAPDLKPAAGARLVCERMRAQGFALVVASSAQKEELQALLKIADIQDLVEVSDTGSNGKKSKPSPDIIEAALNTAELKPNEAIMLGDTPYDILAASKLGVRTIAVRCGGWDDSRLNDAIAIYNDPADLLAHYEESPLYSTVIASREHGPG